MQENSHRPVMLETDQETFRQLAALPATQRRARLRSLLPLIDRLVEQGVPHLAIVASLSQAGIPLKPSSLRQALWRWRKKHASSSRQDLSQFPAMSPPSLGQPALPHHRPATPVATLGSVSSKADLVRLRRDTQPIDLNQLAELGRQK